MNEFSEAELRGIDLRSLWEESPDHPRQVAIGIRHRAKAREYWETEKLDSSSHEATMGSYGKGEV